MIMIMIIITFDTEKLESCGYQIVRNFEEMFIRFDRIHKRDGRMDTARRHIGRAFA